MTLTTESNYHFNSNARFADSEVTGRKSPSIGEPVHNTHSGDTISQDQEKASRSDRMAETTKLPERRTKISQREFRSFSVTLRPTKHDRILYKPLNFRGYEKKSLLDNAAIQSAMSQIELLRILTSHSSTLVDKILASHYKIQIVSHIILPIQKEVLHRFFLAGKIFEETFIVLPNLDNNPIGMSFFEEFSFSIYLKRTYFNSRTCHYSSSHTLGNLDGEHSS